MSGREGGPWMRPVTADGGRDRSVLTGLPCYRSIIALDIEGSTTRINTVKARLRRSMYVLFETALCAGGITERHRDPLVDRGDGVFALIRPLDDIPKTVLLHTVVPVLDQLLTEHNSRRPEERLRMRAAIHAGEVHFDENGCYGEALDLTFRMLDAHQVKRELQQATGSLVLVTSEYIHRTVVRHGYPGINEQSFRPGGMVTIAGRRHGAYVHTPGEQLAERLSAPLTGTLADRVLRGRNLLKPRLGHSQAS